MHIWQTPVPHKIIRLRLRKTLFSDFFLRRRFISTKQIYKKNHTYNTKHTIYKRKEIKAKKKLEILKEGRKRNGGSHYVIQTIERHNPFKLFSLYTFYAIDYVNNL